MKDESHFATPVTTTTADTFRLFAFIIHAKSGANNH